MTSVAQIDVLVLAGGLGTRLRSVVPDAPKVLAPVQGRPFLDHLLKWLHDAGFKRVILSLGYRAEQVVQHLAVTPQPLAVDTVTEPHPLGTGGAIVHCRAALQSDPVLVLNGDSWADIDLQAFVTAHATAGAPLSLAAVPVEDCSRYGEVTLDAQGYVAAFHEKNPAQARPGLINAGIYLIAANILDHMVRQRPTSFEREVLALMAGGGLYAHVVPACRFVDIGTPQSFSDINTRTWFESSSEPTP